MPANIFTKWISEYLEVSMDVAESIQNIIDKYFYLDWSEADQLEMHTVFLAAYEFYLKNASSLAQSPHTCGVFHSVTAACGYPRNPNGTNYLQCQRGLL